MSDQPLEFKNIIFDLGNVNSTTLLQRSSFSFSNCVIMGTGNFLWKPTHTSVFYGCYFNFSTPISSWVCNSEKILTTITRCVYHGDISSTTTYDTVQISQFGGINFRFAFQQSNSTMVGFEFINSGTVYFAQPSVTLSRGVFDGIQGTRSPIGAGFGVFLLATAGVPTLLFKNCPATAITLSNNTTATIRFIKFENYIGAFDSAVRVRQNSNLVMFDDFFIDGINSTNCTALTVDDVSSVSLARELRVENMNVGIAVNNSSKVDIQDYIASNCTTAFTVDNSLAEFRDVNINDCQNTINSVQSTVKLRNLNMGNNQNAFGLDNNSTFVCTSNIGATGATGASGSIFTIDNSSFETNSLNSVFSGGQQTLMTTNNKSSVLIEGGTCSGYDTCIAANQNSQINLNNFNISNCNRAIDLNSSTIYTQSGDNSNSNIAICLANKSCATSNGTTGTGNTSGALIQSHSSFHGFGAGPPGATIAMNDVMVGNNASTSWALIGGQDPLVVSDHTMNPTQWCVATKV